jgi:hypothetical protein
MMKRFAMILLLALQGQKTLRKINQMVILWLNLSVEQASKTIKRLLLKKARANSFKIRKKNAWKMLIVSHHRISNLKRGLQSL